MRFISCFPLSASLFKQTCAVFALSAGVFVSQFAAATTVQFQTVMGDFTVNLYDKTTPKTVANFLAYVNAGAYTNTVIHRSASGFVVQGGGFKYVTTDKLEAIEQNPAVENEPVHSNVRMTIAMAKLGSSANSATNQWFINLADNSGNLDRQNGGFAAFGEVTSGQDVVLAIAGVTTRNLGGAFTQLPLRNYTAEDLVAKKPITNENLVVIESVTVLNADPDTAANLNPEPNTLIKKEDSGGGGGSLGLLALIALGLLALTRKTLLNKA